ncbi:MAG: transposase, partial [Ruminococcus sp.]|nr:transposase [Ruminococcus sp.]
MSNKKGSAPPRYDEEFKKGAMALVTEKGMPLKTAAKNLGICPDTLRSWLNASGYKPAEVAK